MINDISFKKKKIKTKSFYLLKDIFHKQKKYFIYKLIVHKLLLKSKLSN